MNRLDDLARFYELLNRLEQKLGGKRRLRECDARMTWPDRGVYFFFEEGEARSDSGSGARVVRVGTHAVSAGSSSKLWGRLSQHRGAKSSFGGSHRGSVFRLIVGAALIARDPELKVETWGKGNSAPRAVRDAERSLEEKVSHYIGAMPFLWLKADDDPSSSSIRSYIENHSIALLSNASTDECLDRNSVGWLGRYCPRAEVQRSGLWNSRGVRERYDEEFLRVLGNLILAL